MKLSSFCLTNYDKIDRLGNGKSVTRLGGGVGRDFPRPGLSLTNNVYIMYVCM